MSVLKFNIETNLSPIIISYEDTEIRSRHFWNSMLAKTVPHQLIMESNAYN